MRSLPANLAANLATAPYFTKDTAPATRLTVQSGWYLNPVSTGLGTYNTNNYPVRWWQDDNNSQFASEVEIPNVTHVVTDERYNQGAATLEVTILNNATPANGSAGPNSDVFGDPGHLAYTYGASLDASGYFSQTANSWSNVLRENALIRVYQGYGGWWLSVQDAVNQGYLILKGVYLVDTVAVDSQAGTISLSGRNMGKLLLEQYVWPPTVPQSRYTSQGLIYWVTGQDTDVIPAVLGYGGLFEPAIISFSWAANGRGYLLYGSDGAVYYYGSATFKGSMAGTTLVGPIVDGDGTSDGNGYRMAGTDGGVFCYGTAKFHGSLSGIPLAQPIVAMRNTPSGNGYWLVGGDGGIFCFGDAVPHGNLSGVTLAKPIVDFAPTPNGGGYWMLGADGGVFAFGNAGDHGNPTSYIGTDRAVSIDRSATGNGYWVATAKGAVFSYGDAIYHGGVNNITLAAPINRLRRTVTGHGYDMVGEDGGMFAPGGDATFWGSMPGTWNINIAGTYSDYADIIKDLALWAGFYLYPNSTGGVTPAGQKPKVYGNIETTGAYNTLGPLNGQVWDKQSLWDCMQKVAQIVSYVLRVDDQGAIRFEAPNWWSPGNFLEDGTPTSHIPVFFDGKNMTGYTQTTSDGSWVSEILVGTQDPYLFQGAPNDTSIVRFTPPGIQNLHGIQKPAMIGIPLNVPVSTRDEEIMAELLGVQCLLANRQGKLTGIYDPSICVDDQIRIVDRNTGEADIHYVTGVQVDHDLSSGVCLATYTTYWLGNSLTWVINANQDSFLAGSSMTASIYDGNSTLISEQLVEYLAGTGSVRVTQLVGAPIAYPPALGPP